MTQTNLSEKQQAKLNEWNSYINGLTGMGFFLPDKADRELLNQYVCSLKVLASKAVLNQVKEPKQEEKFECEACKTCDDWNHKTHSCDFNGICEEPVNPKLLDREYSMMEH